MFKTILISQPLYFKEETKILLSLFEANLQYFHLRKPESSRDDLKQFLESIPVEYRNRIVLHSHYSLALDYNLRGIHCTANNRDEFYELEHLPIQKSISVHGFCEAGMVDETYDYAFLSPIFNSISKKDHHQAYQHDALQQFLARLRRSSFIALGGISPENIPQCKQMGFEGVATIGSVWESPNPLEQWKRIEAFQEL